MRAKVALLVSAACAAGCSLMMPKDKKPIDSGTDTGLDAADTDVPLDGEDRDTTIEDTPSEDMSEEPACTPDSLFCDGDEYRQCNTSGTGSTLIATCADPAVCVPGSGCDVLEGCEMASVLHEPFGCLFHALPLPMSAGIDTSTFSFGVIVQNPSGENASSVQVWHGTDLVTSVEVSPSNVEHIELPFIDAVLDGLDDETWQSFAVTHGAYRITASAPILAHQYGPLEHDVGTSDTSSVGSTLLVPDHALGTSYIVAGLPPLSASLDDGLTVMKRASYIALVGISLDTTSVDLALAGDTAPGSGGIVAGIAGGHLYIDLEEGDVVIIASAVPPDCDATRPTSVTHTGASGVDRFCLEGQYDLSGTLVSASHPVAVFTGTTGVLVPYDVWHMDHVAEQLVPATALGSTYVAAPLANPGDAVQASVVQIVATADGTVIDTTPAVPGVDSESLDLGEALRFLLEDDPVVIQATHPIAVTELLVGQEYGGGSRIEGDPAMVLLPPVDQWTSYYQVATPETWNDTSTGTTWVLLAADDTATISLDGIPVTSGWRDAAGYQVALIGTGTAGMHVISGDSSFGAVVFMQGPGVGAAHLAGQYFASMGAVGW